MLLFLLLQVAASTPAHSQHRPGEEWWEIIEGETGIGLGSHYDSAKRAAEYGGRTGLQKAIKSRLADGSAVVVEQGSIKGQAEPCPRGREGFHGRRSMRIKLRRLSAEDVARLHITRGLVGSAGPDMKLGLRLWSDAKKTVPGAVLKGTRPLAYYTALRDTVGRVRTLDRLLNKQLEGEPVQNFLSETAKLRSELEDSLVSTYQAYHALASPTRSAVGALETPAELADKAAKLEARGELAEALHYFRLAHRLGVDAAGVRAAKIERAMRPDSSAPVQERK